MPSSHFSKETTRAGGIQCGTTSPLTTALSRFVCSNSLMDLNLCQISGLVGNIARGLLYPTAAVDER